ncbi:MAG: hypothetical protein ACM3X6_12165 [Patescibacteria group bacterium]
MPIIRLPLTRIFPACLKQRAAARTGAQPVRADSRRDSLQKAIDLHRRGVEGDKEAVKQAHALLEKLRAAVPGEDLVEAYYGSVTALLGRDAVDPNERFAKAIEGCKILDNCVSRAPDNTEIRILRAYVCYRLPETFFHRTSTAVEDFNYLVGCYKRDPGVFSADFHDQLLFDLGIAYKNLGRREEAERVWRELLAETDSMKYKRLIRAEGIGAPDARTEDGEKTARTMGRELPAKGMELHGRALAGEKGAAREAADFFARALEESPADPLLQAYHADCLSMTGRDADDPTEMFAAAIKAMKALDAAVNAAPDDVRIRQLRAGQSLRLPEAFFRRTATAVNDLQYLIDRCDRDKALFDDETRWRLLHDLGTCYERLRMTEEAEKAWEKLAALKPSGKYGTLAAERRRASAKGAAGRGTRDPGKASREEALRLHDQAVAGSAEAAETALTFWQEAHAADPHDPEAEGYYGSSMALTGRYAAEPKEIFVRTIKGLVHLNKAIGRDWSNPRLRILRAYLTYSLPEAFFHLTERAVKDFRFLKSAYERDNSVFPRELYLKIVGDLVRGYRRIGQEDRARKVWVRLRKLDPAHARELAPEVNAAPLEAPPSEMKGDA